MNRILVTARKARGATEEEVAEALDLDVTAYSELECQIKRITPQIAQALSAYFSVPSFYFMDNKPPDIQGRINFLEQQKAKYNEPQHRDIPANAPMAVVTAILELLVTKEALTESLMRELELTEDLSAVIIMNAHLNEQLTARSSLLK